ncbi:hypothetical protein ACFVFJ_44575 [Streptomyces sp. NPDC057717]|uniref:hypothetical protein n=1 Tax=Streptomyces sp. NPDC057717 TaxID=3346224 RepID=UPI00369B0A6B
MTDRTPYTHKIRYGVTGAPQLPGHRPGNTLDPTVVELLYAAPRDGRPARVDVMVTGWWMRDGERVQPERQVAHHWADGPEDWPDWLVKEAQLHEPAAAPSAPEPTRCSDPPCNQGGTGEPCDRHETEQAHAEGEHAFCGVTCEAEFPTETLRNGILAKGYPGTAGMLNELLRRARHEATAAPSAPADRTAEAHPAEQLVHVGWWCWRGDNHGHLVTAACRSDNVPLHAPAEWADEMRAVIQRIEDGDEPKACTCGPDEACGDPCDGEAQQAGEAGRG